MTTSASSPSSRAPQATAWAWLPAEIEMTPRSFSAGESAASFASTPRTLKEPVRWNSSALRNASAPSRSDSVLERRSGVRCRRPPAAARARSTSGRETLIALARGAARRRSRGERIPLEHPRRDGQSHRERGQLARPALDGDAAAHRLGQLLHDREPEARADRALPAVARVQVEALEGVLAILVGEPGTGVLDA